MIPISVLAAWASLVDQVSALLTRLTGWPRPKSPPGAPELPRIVRPRPPAPPSPPAVFPCLALAILIACGLTACGGCPPATPSLAELRLLCDQVAPCEACPPAATAPAVPR